MRTVGWGLIGCGDIARKRVAPALRDLDNCELVAVSRADFARAVSDDRPPRVDGNAGQAVSEVLELIYNG